MAALSDEEDEELARDLESLNRVLQGDLSTDKHGSDHPHHNENLEKLKLCFQKNLELQAELQSRLKQVEEAIEINKDKLEAITNPKRNKLIMPRRLTFWGFKRGKYFRDHLGALPPTTQDGCGDLCGVHYESPWTRSFPETKLVDGIRCQLIEQLTRPLLEQLQTEPEGGTESRKIKQQLNTIKHKTDQQLFSLLNENNFDWSSLSYEIFGHKRSASDCRLHWINHMKPGLNKGAWSKEEDRQLVKLAKKYNQRDWQRIAKEMGTNRTAFSCLKHYQTARTISKGCGKWSETEDEKLKSAVSLYGPHNWVKVAHLVGGGRSSMNCYHRWTMSVSPDIKRGKWSEKENELLREGVRVHGKKAWSKVCQFVPGRSQSQCRDHYLNVLDTDLKKGPWTREEDLLLLKACKPYEGGTIPWSKVATMVPHRTDAMCNTRWKQLKPDEEVFKQYTYQALKKAVAYDRTSERIDATALEDSGNIPEVIKEKLEKFKVRYMTREKRRLKFEKNPYPSPSSVMSMDTSVLNDFLTSAQIDTLKYMLNPLLRSTNSSAAKSTSAAGKQDPDLANEQAVDKAVESLLSSFMASNSEKLASLSSSYRRRRAIGEFSDLTQHSTDSSTTTNLCDDANNTQSGSQAPASAGTTAESGGDDNILEMLLSRCESPINDQSTISLKPLPSSFHTPPVSSDSTSTQRTPDPQTKSTYSVSTSPKSSNPTSETSTSTFSTSIGSHSYSRDRDGKVVRIRSSQKKSPMRGDGGFPVGPRFVVCPAFTVISTSKAVQPSMDNERIGTSTCDSNADITQGSSSNLETEQFNDNSVAPSSSHSDVPITSSFSMSLPQTIATTSAASLTLSKNISTKENDDISVRLKDKTSAYVALPEDSTVSQQYAIKRQVTDGVTLIDSKSGVEGESSKNHSLVTGDAHNQVTYSHPVAKTQTLSSGDQSLSVSSTQGCNEVVSNESSSAKAPSESRTSVPSSGTLLLGNFTEMEQILAAQLLRFTPKLDWRVDLKREKLNDLFIDLAGFDLPIMVAPGIEVLMESDAHIIVYEPNTHCNHSFSKIYRKKVPKQLNAAAERQKVQIVSKEPMFEQFSNDDLISQHFAMSRVPILPSKIYLENQINLGIMSEYVLWLQAQASYDILYFEHYDPWLKSVYKPKRTYRKGPQRCRNKSGLEQDGPKPKRTRQTSQKKTTAKTVEVKKNTRKKSNRETRARKQTHQESRDGTNDSVSSNTEMGVHSNPSVTAHGQTSQVQLDNSNHSSSQRLKRKRKCQTEKSNSRTTSSLSASSVHTSGPSKTIRQSISLSKNSRASEKLSLGADDTAISPSETVKRRRKSAGQS